MSHRRDEKRTSDGGHPADIPAPSASDIAVDRVRSLLRTWEKFGGGTEQNMIAELGEALGGAK